MEQPLHAYTGYFLPAPLNLHVRSKLKSSCLQMIGSSWLCIPAAVVQLGLDIPIWAVPALICPCVHIMGVEAAAHMLEFKVEQGNSTHSGSGGSNTKLQANTLYNSPQARA